MTLQAATSKSACIDIPSPYDMELIELHNPHKIPTGIMVRSHLEQLDYFWDIIAVNERFSSIDWSCG